MEGQQRKILTIVVPSYNTANYIDKCIPTLLCHRMRQQLEILLVNDGSTDQTLHKLRYYEEIYPETVRVIDKKNGGHGSVVNLGIQEARGKYLKVIDGDDWIISKNLERLMHCLVLGDFDLAVNPYIKYHMKTDKQKMIRFCGKKNQKLDFDSVAERISEIEIHAATYRTQLLRENNISVRENCFYEDTQYNIYPIRYVKSLYVMDFPVYVYCIGSKGQSISPQKAYENRAMHQAVVMDCCNYYMRNTKMSKQKRTYIERIICKRILSQYLLYMKNFTYKQSWKMPAFKAQQPDGCEIQSDYKEMLEWDKKLQIKFPYFYTKTNHFPISWLRTGKKNYWQMVYMMYFLYSKVKWIF